MNTHQTLDKQNLPIFPFAIVELSLSTKLPITTSTHIPDIQTWYRLSSELLQLPVTTYNTAVEQYNAYNVEANNVLEQLKNHQVGTEYCQLQHKAVQLFPTIWQLTILLNWYAVHNNDLTLLTGVFFDDYNKANFKKFKKLLKKQG